MGGRGLRVRFVVGTLTPNGCVEGNGASRDYSILVIRTRTAGRGGAGVSKRELVSYGALGCNLSKYRSMAWFLTQLIPAAHGVQTAAWL